MAGLFGSGELAGRGRRDADGGVTSPAFRPRKPIEGRAGQYGSATRRRHGEAVLAGVRRGRSGRGGSGHAKRRLT